MSNPTSNFNWQMPTNTDLVTDLPADFEVFGQAVDTSLADLKGGTTGQILSKASATDMDFTWIANDQGDITGVTAGVGISGGGTSGTVTVTNSMATAITTAGDTIYGTGSGTFARLGIGTAGQVLTVNGGATAPSWAAPASGGGMTLLSTTTLSGTSTTISSISGSYIDLKVVIYGVNVNAAGSYFKCSLNGDLTSNFGNIFAPTATGASQTYYSIGADTVWLAYNNPMLNASTVNGFEINISNYSNTSTIKAVNSVSSFITSGTSRRFESSDSYYINTAAVTSLVFAGNTFNGGTVLVYGVK